MYYGQFLNGPNDKGISSSIFIHENHISIHCVNADELKELKWNIEKTYVSNKFDLRTLSLKNYEFPDQELKIESSSNFLKHFTSAKHRHIGFYFRQWKFRGVFILAIITVLFIVISCLLYFRGLPAISDRIAKNVPLEYEITLGENIFKNTVSNEKIDSSKSTLLNAFYSQLNFPSNYPIHVSYLNESFVNAFALPGGHIVVHAGIISKMNRYEELAALLAHESSHINERHSTRTIFKSIGGFSIVSFLFGDASGLIAVIAENANMMHNLSYSRTLEEEADRKGIDLMIKSKIDIQGMVTLFKALESEEKKLSSENHVTNFLSTHPLTTERIKIAVSYSKKQQIKEQQERLIQLFNQIKSHE
jgi:predicted Zn-dependent protease